MKHVKIHIYKNPLENVYLFIFIFLFVFSSTNILKRVWFYWTTHLLQKLKLDNLVPVQGTEVHC